MSITFVLVAFTAIMMHTSVFGMQSAEPAQVSDSTSDAYSGQGIVWEKVNHDDLTFFFDEDVNCLAPALYAQFPRFAEQGISLILLINHLIWYRKNPLFYWCTEPFKRCIMAPVTLRLFVLLPILHDIIDRYPDRTTPLTHLDLGEEGCLQTYLLILGLRYLGYQHIRAILINLEGSCLDEYAQRLQEVFQAQQTITIISKQRKIETPFAEFFKELTEQHDITTINSFALIDPASTIVTGLSPKASCSSINSITVLQGESSDSAVFIFLPKHGPCFVQSAQELTPPLQQLISSYNQSSHELQDREKLYQGITTYGQTHDFQQLGYVNMLDELAYLVQKCKPAGISPIIYQLFMNEVMRGLPFL